MNLPSRWAALGSGDTRQAGADETALSYAEIKALATGKSERLKEVNALLNMDEKDNGKWCWFSRDVGGRSALDYLIKVRGMTFLDAVQHLTGQTQPYVVTAPAEQAEPKVFKLPPADYSIAEVERYLVGRGIDRELIRACTREGMLYQTRNKGYANAVFVGFDNRNVARYATIRGIRGDFKGDVTASDKRYSFAMAGSGGELHLFESAVDLLSYATIANGWGYWNDEQPDDEIKRRVEMRLDAEGWKVDVVLSHTCPLKYEPRETFIQGIDESGVDKSTELWLDSIEDRLEYGQWLCGHFHINKVIDRLRFLATDIREFV